MILSTVVMLHDHSEVDTRQPSSMSDSPPAVVLLSSNVRGTKSRRSFPSPPLSSPRRRLPPALCPPRARASLTAAGSQRGSPTGAAGLESRGVTWGGDESPPAVMLDGMQGSKIGVWIAHGEGKVTFPDAERLAPVVASGCAPIKYVDASGDATEAYPLNPNGSPLGIAGLCSKDGRHLAMMPPPARAFRGWQMPWFPGDVSGLSAEGPGPWLRMFQNARVWAEKQ